MRGLTAATLLLTGICLANAGLAGDENYRGDGNLFVSPDELEWGPVASMGEGAEIAILEGDTSQEEPFTLRLRLEDGYEILPHVHPEYERVTVLSGNLHFAEGEEFDRDKTRRLEPGSVVIMAPGEPMYGYAEGETIIQLHGTGPWGIDYTDAEDDPRKQ